MKSIEFSFQTRSRQIRDLPQKSWDLLVIGGGVTGAACARDAALRGISCLLVEASDFASGTSSGSSKLLHGGVRYLEQREFKLVYHAIQERELLKKLYYPLVRDIDFVFPTYRKVFPPKFLLDLGLSLYDAFSFFRKRHQRLSKEEMLTEFPQLLRTALTGGMIYQDSFAEDYRLVIEIIKSAQNAGAFCLNRLRLKAVYQTPTGFDVELEDQETGQTLKTFSKKIVNCAGPFSDEIKEILKLPPRLHLTQGVHFVLPREKFAIDKAFVMSDPDNKRVLFAIPWNSITFLGTTDTSISEARTAQASKEDLNYVLRIFRKYFDVKLEASDFIQSWAAVRPLIQPDTAEANSDISREHQIEEKPSGFYHILGGKLTSHRLMAEEAVDLIAKSLDLDRKSKTDQIPLQQRALSASKIDRLERVYGHYSSDVLELDSQLALHRKQISNSLPHLEAEIIYSIRYEMALHPLDFLRRRSSIYYESSSVEVAENVCRVFQKEMNWDEARFQREFEICKESYQKDGQAMKS